MSALIDLASLPHDGSLLFRIADETREMGPGGM